LTVAGHDPDASVQLIASNDQTASTLEIVYMPRRKEIPNLDHIIERYMAGVPLQRLSKETGYARTVLSRRLIEAGIEIRSCSDGQRTRWRDASNRDNAANA